MLVLYYLFVAPFLYLISYLPFRILYFLSDVLFFILYRLAGYRKKVVHQNLKNSFPEKSDQEIKSIANAYYHHLCDLIMESVKGLTISKEQIMKRCMFEQGGLDVFETLFKERKDVILLMGHYGNWEWSGLSMSCQSKYKLMAVYKKQSNRFFDGLIYKLRNRFGLLPVPTENTARELLKSHTSPACTFFIADQTPPRTASLWITFLNQTTPVYQGAEKIARRINSAVVYAAVRKVKRGHYQIHVEIITHAATDTTENEITISFNKHLEKDIQLQPEIWLWSHRRWKHSNGHSASNTPVVESMNHA